MDATSEVAASLGDKRPTEPKRHVRADTQKPLTFTLEKAPVGEVEPDTKPASKDKYPRLKRSMQARASQRKAKALEKTAPKPEAPGLWTKHVQPEGPKKSEPAKNEALEKAEVVRDDKGPNLWSKHTQAPEPKKSEPAQNEALEKGVEEIKAKARPRAEPSLKQKSAAVKAQYREKGEKPFHEQVEAVKQRYGVKSLGKTLQAHLQKGGIPQVAVVAVMDGGKLLMGRRKDNGRYTFPAGHANPGEDIHATAARELYEEAGLRPNYLQYLGKKVMRGHDGQRRMIHAFLCRASHANATTEHDPDREIHRWESVPVSGGHMPRQVEDALYVPRSNNIILQFLEENS